MSTEFSEAAGKSSETNPLRISNCFHLAVGAANILAGGVVAFLIARQVEEDGVGVLPLLAVAAILLVVGLHQTAQAWRDDKFKFHPDHIGGFAVPEKFNTNGRANEAGYVVEVLNDGVQPPPTPDNALLKKLYSWLPKLELAPQVIRWHAETQVLRIVNLTVAVLGLLLMWVFSRPDVFALLVPFYLLLAIDPAAVWRNAWRGRGGDQQLDRPKAPTPAKTVGILLLSIFVPILLGMLPAEALPRLPVTTSSIVIPTVCAMAAMLVASALFVLSLRAQTRDLSTSGVGHLIRKDVEVAVGSGLIGSLEGDLPYPRKQLAHTDDWHRGGEFGGSLLVEAEQEVNAIGNHGSALGAIARAWNDKEQWPLVGLGGLGVAMGLAGTMLAVLFTLAPSLTTGLVALALFSASQFALLAARGLWNRVDFRSTIYRIRYGGNCSTGQRVAGNSVTGPGSLSETTVRVDHVKFAVCVARLQSVAFARGGSRYIQSVDLRLDECEVQYQRIHDHYANVMRRKGMAYREEHLVRSLVQGEQLPKLPDGGAQEASRAQLLETVAKGTTQ
ncbi:hypothetical protein LY625_09885 [Lysobacter sp. GX 14042]|uniref:hypothetical protein n=1 Tax=Lysobacter sp. GX 14042 TaxID=2907155 RepID=UPI001F3B42F9|nr:hypothetical protein [Lysobacter sp. GX 14042]MCE7032917.1 hypothetical protein [Lysobacter sp. GX 14042]